SRRHRPRAPAAQSNGNRTVALVCRLDRGRIAGGDRHRGVHMMLEALIFVPVLGASLAWAGARAHHHAPRLLSLLTLAIDLALLMAVWLLGQPGPWIAETHWPWIPELGISFRLGLDGLSLLLIILTIGLGFLAVLASWTEITERVGAFHLNLLLTLAG